MNVEMQLFDVKLPSRRRYQPPGFVGVPYQKHSEPSRESAEQIASHVGRLQAEVFNYITEHGPCSDSQINEGLGKTGNGIRPRRVELVYLGKIKQHGSVVQSNGRRATTWVVV